MLFMPLVFLFSIFFINIFINEVYVLSPLLLHPRLTNTTPACFFSTSHNLFYTNTHTPNWLLATTLIHCNTPTHFGYRTTFITNSVHKPSFISGLKYKETINFLTDVVEQSNPLKNIRINFCTRRFTYIYIFRCSSLSAKLILNHFHIHFDI